jgi:two-component system OmpR family response regulator
MIVSPIIDVQLIAQAGERELARALFVREGFEAVVCEHATALDALMTTARLALIVMDVMMPGEDGFSVCRRLAANNGPPVILVTARGEDIDRIIGLEVGAEDYLPKPFNPRELVARARAVLPRTARAVPEPIEAGDEARGEMFLFEGWSLNTGSRAFTDPVGQAVELSAGEYDLLTCFMNHPQRVLSRDFLMDWTKGREAAAFDRSVDVIEVADRGKGIPASDLERVLAPFERLEPSRNRQGGGAGLGLAIVKGLVEMHGGKFSLGNRAEGGAIARIELKLSA